MAILPAPLRIRPALPGDAATLSRLISDAVAAFAGEGPAEAWRAYERRSRDVAARLACGTVLVAERGGEVVGTVTRTGDGFGALFVAPAARGGGVGRALVDVCVAEARIAGATTLIIHTARPMRAARRLYGRAGFRRAPRLDLLASQVEAFDPAGGDVRLLAYRLDLAAQPAGKP